jgi:hypothetical protein
MHELNDQELYQAIKHARSLDETAGRKILTQFQSDQPVLSQMIFNLFSASIAEKNQEMSYLFMDLCFDVICIYQHVFGKIPAQSELSTEWLEQQATLIGTQLQSIAKQKKADNKTQASLEEHFALNSAVEVNQTGLVRFMNESVNTYAAEDPSRNTAIKITQTMLFVMIHLLGNIYNHTKQQQTVH